MHQAIDAARQSDENAEVGDGLDLSGDAIVLVVAGCELRPGVGLALLEAQRNAPALLVDVEDHDLDLIADLHDLRRIDVLVGPVHFRHVDQASTPSSTSTKQP